MARRMPAEVLVQREAWLARKASREAGQDMPFQPPLRPGEVSETPAELEVSQASAEPETFQPIAEAAQSVQAEVIEPIIELETVQPIAEPATARPKPESPARKRTPEEVRAQREAFMAARAAGQTPVPTSTATPTATPALAAAPVVEKMVAAPASAVVKAAPKPKTAPPPPAPKTAVPASEAIDTRITRRELLNYAWLASLALLSIETVGISLWFAFPNFKAGQFGGLFAIGAAAEVLPEVNAIPIPYTDGKFWLVNLDTQAGNGESRKGILALYKVCTHLGCLYEWVPITNRFECPCHGSKFELTGDYIEGPARRSLDRFIIQAAAADGSIKETDAEGNPLLIEGNETLIVDTGKRILGASVV